MDHWTSSLRQESRKNPRILEWWGSDLLEAFTMRGLRHCWHGHGSHCQRGVEILTMRHNFHCGMDRWGQPSSKLVKRLLMQQRVSEVQNKNSYSSHVWLLFSVLDCFTNCSFLNIKRFQISSGSNILMLRSWVLHAFGWRASKTVQLLLLEKARIWYLAFELGFDRLIVWLLRQEPFWMLGKKNTGVISEAAYVSRIQVQDLQHKPPEETGLARLHPALGRSTILNMVENY